MVDYTDTGDRLLTPLLVHPFLPVDEALFVLQDLACRAIRPLIHQSLRTRPR